MLLRTRINSHDVAEGIPQGGFTANLGPVLRFGCLHYKQRRIIGVKEPPNSLRV